MRCMTYSPRSTMPDSHHLRTLTDRVARPDRRVADLFRFTIDSCLHAADLRKCETGLTRRISLHTRRPAEIEAR
jgi:hypothetical protein